MTGNNGTSDTGYVQSVKDKTKAAPAITSGSAGLFRDGTNTGHSAYADFSQSIDPYNSNSQGSAGGGTYTVRSGDTLQAIAAALYGDGNLWYRLAEANGLSAQSSLTEGQSLILPAGVTKSAHNAATFQPYGATEAMGDTLPTTPKPPKKPKCGAFGQIISTVVAIAASQILGPVLGNLVSQGFNMVLGLQSKFSWKSLGLTVVGSMVSGGLSGAFEGVKSAFLQGALQQATTSALTQGIGVATGLQKKFNFAGVAAAGVAGGVMGWAGSRLGRNAAFKGDKGGLNRTGAFLANSAGAIAEAATLSVLKDNSFGDNLLASLPSVIARAGLDAAGAKSILGDGWLGTALADPGSVLGKGWITEAANTVGEKIAQAVKSSAGAQSGGGGIGVYASRLLSAPQGSSGKFGFLKDAGAAGDGWNATRKDALPPPGRKMMVFHEDGSFHIERVPYEEKTFPSQKKGAAVKPKAANASKAVNRAVTSDTEFVARMDAVIADIDRAAIIADTPLAGNYDIPLTAIVAEIWDDVPIAALGGTTISDISRSLSGAANWMFSRLNADAAQYERDAAANDRYYATRPFQNIITKPFRLLDNGVYASAQTLTRIVPGTLSAIANPKQAGIGWIQGWDATFRNDSNLDGVADPGALSRMRSSSAREGVMYFSEKATIAGVALSPLKAKSGLAFEAREFEILGKKVPNPYGKLGGPEHKALVEQIVADINARSGMRARTEFYVPTPNGSKTGRFIDVVAIDIETRLPVEFYQVGKQTQRGLPISREARAIRDVQAVRNTPIFFAPYNGIGR